MAYKALYREWRPQKFEEVVGQEHIVTTLKNQIKHENISHAYLFSGTRGTGKTTIAKLFARTLNCLNIDEKNVNPCNTCELCVGIIKESIMDVIEIDAASNNGVDHIRTIRENVGYTPARGKYKVYIIDEVHMLSIGAFNALLKTLEEPPKHVIFILATTEPHKLPVTIISRCQRFNFKPVNNDNIISRLNEVCQSLSVESEKKAIQTIAVNAKGSLRDALSILEQCIILADKQLTYENVIKTLGITNDLLLKELVEAISARDVVIALNNLQKILSEGNDVKQLNKQLIEFFREMLMMKMNVESLHGGNAEMEKGFYRIINEIDVDRIVKIMNVLAETESKARYSTQAQIFLEIAIVTICKERCETTGEGLEDRLSRIEKLMSSKELFREQDIKKKESERKVPYKATTIIKNAESKEKITEKSSNYNEQSEKKSITAQTRREQKNKIESINKLEIEKVWGEVLERIIKDKKAHLKAFLREGEFQEIKDDSIVIEFKEGFGFHCATLNKEENKEYLLDLLFKITGQEMELFFIMQGEANEREVTSPKDIEKQLREILPTEAFEVLE
ncbi:MAG: DNA polymerase III subunit gamma/tau [Alkaliphilus sp.]